MKNNVYIFLLLILFFACEENSSNPPTTDQIVEDLQQAYRDASLPAYQEILEQWAADVSAKREKDLDTETEKNIYSIFQIFYSPDDISRLGDHEWGEMYTNYDYAVVQNHVYYNYGYHDYDPYLGADTIWDFRPEIEIEGKTVLYLTDDYGRAIYDFLGMEENPFRPEGAVKVYPIDKMTKRLEFLQEYLPIITGHWGCYLHIETHPEMLSLSFTEDEDRAMAFFRVGYMFGQAYFSRGNEWKLDSSEINMIE